MKHQPQPSDHRTAPQRTPNAGRSGEPVTDIRKVFILGNHIQALGVSRMAAAIGLEVRLFNNYGASVTRFSNTCRRFYRFRDREHLLELLLDHAGSNDTLLVATNDDLVGFMADHYDLLHPRYVLSIPPPETVRLCFNKRFTYQRAREAGIPIPDSHFPDSLEEVRALAPRIEYPVILKPAVMYTFHQATGKKVFFCKDPDELITHYQRIRQIIPADEVILQEFLTGGAPSLYSFGSFFARGEVYGSLIANRIRQKPMDFGISTCFAHTVINPEIEELAIRFLKEIDYFGMSEVEFMLDPKTGSFKLLEINPRTWKWHSIANKLDINLFEMMVRFLENKPVTKKINDRAGVGWIERLTDSYVVLQEMRKGRLHPREYLRTLRLPAESATWSAKDPLPAIMYLLLSPYLLIKRN